jgi:hypothetical protein
MGTHKHTKKNPMTRLGKAISVLPKGDRRRMSDGKNAWRKMTPEQRRVFLDWMAEENLTVAEPDDA